MTKRTNRKRELQATLRRRLLTIIFLSTVASIGLLRFGPYIGSALGMISVNRNAEIIPPKANTPPPIFVDLPEATNKTTVDIRGFSAPKTQIELFVNGPKKDTVLTDASGEFLFTGISLNKATNTIFAKADGSKSAVHTIKYDNKDPKIEITNLKDGDKIENLNDRIEIEGEISEEASITINGRTVIQKPDNSFSFLLGVEEGEVEIKVRATDAAGNIGEEEIKVQYKRK